VQFVFILEQVLNGLLVGAYYLLIALGLSLIFALGGIVNLAHGGFYAIGAYLAVVLATASDLRAHSSSHPLSSAS
jgi:branched-chain amino acid transport system permease protein